MTDQKIKEFMAQLESDPKMAAKAMAMMEPQPKGPLILATYEDKRIREASTAERLALAKQLDGVPAWDVTRSDGYLGFREYFLRVTASVLADKLVDSDLAILASQPFCLKALDKDNYRSKFLEKVSVDALKQANAGGKRVPDAITYLDELHHHVFGYLLIEASRMRLDGLAEVEAFLDKLGVLESAWPVETQRFFVRWVVDTLLATDCLGLGPTCFSGIKELADCLVAARDVVQRLKARVQPTPSAYTATTAPVKDELDMALVNAVAKKLSDQLKVTRPWCYGCQKSHDAPFCRRNRKKPRESNQVSSGSPNSNGPVVDINGHPIYSVGGSGLLLWKLGTAYGELVMAIDSGAEVTVVRPADAVGFTQRDVVASLKVANGRVIPVRKEVDIPARLPDGSRVTFTAWVADTDRNLMGLDTLAKLDAVIHCRDGRVSLGPAAECCNVAPAVPLGGADVVGPALSRGAGIKCKPATIAVRKGQAPVFVRGQRHNRAELAIMETIVDRWCKIGIAEKVPDNAGEVDGLWNFNVLLVLKKNGTHRMVVNYAPLNRVTGSDSSWAINSLIFWSVISNKIQSTPTTTQNEVQTLLEIIR